MTRTRLRVLIAGGGELGFRTATRLDERGHNIVVIERDSDACERLHDAYVGTVIEGDATEPEVLEQAGPHRCDAVAALTGSVQTNLTICTVAREFADVRTVLRSPSEELDIEDFDTVDEIVYPETLGAIGAVNAVEGDTVRTVEGTNPDLNIFEIRLAEHAAVAGERLGEVSLPRGGRIVADATAGELVGDDTRLEADRIYVVVAETGVQEEVLQLLRE